jgi:hypothetical protein
MCVVRIAVCIVLLVVQCPMFVLFGGSAFGDKEQNVANVSSMTMRQDKTVRYSQHPAHDTQQYFIYYFY